MKCPKCGKFVSNVVAHYYEPDKDIEAVTAKCKTHGEVTVTDWEWDDFFGETDLQAMSETERKTDI